MGLFNFEFDGRSRRFAFFLPPDWPDHYGELPLVVCLHGGGQSIEEFASSIDLLGYLAGDYREEDTEDLPRVAVLLPEGLSHLGIVEGSWNTGWSPNVAVPDPDDVGFIMACIQQFREALEQDYPNAAELPPSGQVAIPSVDPFRHVFGMGFSAGGSMLYRLASQQPGVFDAIAVVAGAAGGFRFARDSAEPSREFVWGPGTAPFVSSVLHIHGIQDVQVPLAGGPALGKIIRLQPYGQVVATNFVPFTGSQDDSLDLWLAPRGKTVQSAANLERADALAPGVQETEWSDERVVTTGTQVEVFVTWRVRRVVHGAGHEWPVASRLGWDATPYVFDWFDSLR